MSDPPPLPRRGQPGHHGGDQPRSHHELMSLLGAWALWACPPDEARSVEEHLSDCAPCADEAVRLRDAAALLTPQRGLDMSPRLRARVLEASLLRRPARQPVPSWAAPYDAEAARLDALLTDITAEEWRTPVTLRWFAEDAWLHHTTTVAGVLDHLFALDGLVARAIGLPDPLGLVARGDPMERTLVRWKGEGRDEHAWLPWRGQSQELVRAAARTGGRTGEWTVPLAGYGDPGLFPGRDTGELALSDAYLYRAFALWVHGTDIADAVSYPYGDPLSPHLRSLVDLTARRLTCGIATRRRAGFATLPARLTTAGTPGRTVHLEVEGAGGGDWYIPLDSPEATVSRSAARRAVAHVAMDGAVFCQLAAGRITPSEAASGVEGDADAIHDVLHATADLSRL